MISDRLLRLLRGFWTAGARVLPHLLLSLTACHGAAQGIEGFAIPEPDLSSSESVVREQIETAQSRVETVVADKVGGRSLAQAYGRLGQVYHAYHFAEAAISCYRNARGLDPSEFAWPYYLGQLYEDQGGSKEAIESLAAAMELRPDYTAGLIALARAHAADNQTEAAKDLFRKALKHDPSSAGALAGLGRIALSSDDYESAIAWLEQALSLQPKAASLHYSLAMACRKKGDLAAAKYHLGQQGPQDVQVADPLLEEIDNLRTGQMALWNRGNQAMAEGRYGDAVEAYQRMATLAGDDPLPRIYVGNALAQKGDWNGALDQYQHVLRLRPSNPTAHYNLGVVLLQLRREQDSMQAFREALGLDPGLRVAHFQLANLLMRDGHYEEAIQHYARVIELSPDNEFARLMKSMTLVRSRRYSEARSELEEAVKSMPDGIDVTSALARLLAASPEKQIRDPGRALELIESLLRTRPDQPFDLVETYAMALAADGQFQQAVALQKRMIAAVENSQAPELAVALHRNLSLYENDQPCSLPWPDDHPIFVPRPGKMQLLTPSE